MREPLGFTFQESGTGLFCSWILKVIGRREVQDTGPDLRDTDQPKRKRRRKKKKKRSGREEEKELTFEGLLCARHCFEHFLNINSFVSCISSKLSHILEKRGAEIKSNCQSHKASKFGAKIQKLGAPGIANALK